MGSKRTGKGINILHRAAVEGAEHHISSGVTRTHPCKGVLIVEDERDLRETLAAVFEMEGISTSTAANGREALEVLRQSPPPCLILLDLMMPVMSGWEFLSARRSTAHLRSIPVVVATAFSERLPDTDVDRVISKPLDFDRLLSVVSPYCRNAA